MVSEGFQMKEGGKRTGYWPFLRFELRSGQSLVDNISHEGGDRISTMTLGAPCVKLPRICRAACSLSMRSIATRQDYSAIPLVDCNVASAERTAAVMTTPTVSVENPARRTEISDVSVPNAT